MIGVFGPEMRTRDRTTLSAEQEHGFGFIVFEVVQVVRYIAEPTGSLNRKGTDPP